MILTLLLNVWTNRFDIRYSRIFLDILICNNLTFHIVFQTRNFIYIYTNIVLNLLFPYLILTITNLQVLLQVSYMFLTTYSKIFNIFLTNICFRYCLYVDYMILVSTTVVTGGFIPFKRPWALRILPDLFLESKLLSTIEIFCLHHLSVLFTLHMWSFQKLFSFTIEYLWSDRLLS